MDYRRPILRINNSFSTLEHFEQEVLDTVGEVLTVHNDIDREKMFLEKKIQYLSKVKDRDPKLKRSWGFAKKKLKDLLASEYVYHLVDGRFPTGLLEIVRDVLELLKVIHEYEDDRVIPAKKHEFLLCKEFHDPRYYQQEIHKLAMSAGRGVIESAVGSGKTDMAMRLVWDLGVNTLIVAPGKPLLNQWEPILEAHFGRRQVIRLGSEELSATKLRKMRKKPIRLVNIQALAAARKKGCLEPLLKDVDMIVFDEFHHAGSKSYTGMLEDFEHIYHRYGFTGTFLRNDSKTLDLWGVLSTKLYSYPAWKAIEDEFLTPIEVITHELEGVAKQHYQSEYSANYCGTAKKKPKALLARILRIVTKMAGPDEPVLILVNQKDKCGAIISTFLDEQGIDNTYISGDSDSEVITQALADFNAGKIKILIGSQIIGEGIDIRAARHLILANGGKSEIAIVQATGRLVRLNLGKYIGYLHDFDFLETKYLGKHAKMRRDILKRNFAPEFKKS